MTSCHVISQSHSTHVMFSPLLFLHLFHSLPELVHEHFLLLFQCILKINLLMTQLREGEKEKGKKGERREQGRRGVKKGEKHNEGRGTLLKNKKEGITCSSVACLVSVSFSSLSIFFVSLLICCSCSCSNVCSNCTFS